MRRNVFELGGILNKLVQMMRPEIEVVPRQVYQRVSLPILARTLIGLCTLDESSKGEDKCLPL